MVSMATTGSRVLDIISQKIIDYTIRPRDYDEILNTQEIYDEIVEDFIYQDFYVIDPMVEVKLKGYMTKDQILRIAEIVKDFSERETWTVADLRAAVREAGVYIDV